MRNIQTTGIAAMAAIYAVALGLLVGWVLNIVTLFRFIGEPLLGNEIEIFVRAIGVFAVPLGGIIGWL